MSSSATPSFKHVIVDPLFDGNDPEPGIRQVVPAARAQRLEDELIDWGMADDLGEPPALPDVN